MRCDISGRAIVFDIGTATFGNFYAHSGTDGVSRTSRESFFGETIPNLLLNSQSSGCLGGDLNMIIDKKDATKNHAQKISPSLRRLTKAFNWSDSYRSLHPDSATYSHYYDNKHGDGAARIDRQYHCRDIAVT